MKPRNKKEQYIIDEINPLIDDSTIDTIPFIAFPHFQNKGEVKKNVYVCGCCGNVINCTNNMHVCPYCLCDVGLNINDNNLKRKWHKWKSYFTTEIIKDFQVIRFFEVEYFLTKGLHAKVLKNEIGRAFISLNKKNELDISVLGLPIYTANYEMRFRYNAEFTFLKTDSFIKMFPKMKCELVGKLKLTDFIKKRGYAYNKKITINLLDYLLDCKKDNFLETLYKLKQFNLINSFYAHFQRNSLKQFKKEILLIIKWNGKFDKFFDFGMFCDYLDLAKNCGFDTKTKEILLFKNLKKAHDQMHNLYIAKQEEIELRKCSQKDIKYIESKSKYFNLDLGKENIKIVVLKNVKEFRDIGKKLNHCVFSNKYYEKEKSLILNCYFKDELFETAEIDLNTLKLIQLRGNNNQDSIHHLEFKELIEKNKKIIRKVS